MSGGLGGGHACHVRGIYSLGGGFFFYATYVCMDEGTNGRDGRALRAFAFVRKLEFEKTNVFA